ncbi:hypothetical protein [Rhizobium sp. PAMB 3182]
MIFTRDADPERNYSIKKAGRNRSFLRENEANLPRALLFRILGKWESVKGSAGEGDAGRSWQCIPPRASKKAGPGHIIHVCLLYRGGKMGRLLPPFSKFEKHQ